MKTNITKCLICKKYFSKQIHNQKLCSPRCQKIQQKKYNHRYFLNYYKKMKKIFGKYWKKNKCIDCGKPIHRTSTRCRSCWAKLYNKNNFGKHASNYKDGRTLKSHYCKDCGKKISYSAWRNGTQRCNNCCFRLKTKHKHHLFGKKYKDIIILTMKQHIKLHHGAYFYLLKKYGKRGIINYIKWFAKKQHIKICI